MKQTKWQKRKKYIGEQAVRELLMLCLSRRKALKKDITVPMEFAPYLMKISLSTSGNLKEGLIIAGVKITFC